MAKDLIVMNRFYPDHLTFQDPRKAAVGAACRAAASEHPSWIVKHTMGAVTYLYRVAPDGVLTGPVLGQTVDVKV